MSDFKRCYACRTDNPLEQTSCIKCGGVNFDLQPKADFGLTDYGTESNPGITFDASSGLSSPKKYSHNFENVDISRTGTGLKVESDSVVLTTGQLVPGREITEVIGLVFAAGNAAWTIEGTSKKSNTAMGKAAGNMMIQAEDLGADAVIAIQMSMDGSGTAINRSQTVTLIGTAVKLAQTDKQD